MIRLGLLGCGAVASYGHMPAIRRTPGLELAAIYDPDAGRLEEARRRFEVPRAFPDLEALFQSGIDAVVVTSPAPAHLGNVTLAAKHRKPVLCEKPLAMNDAEAGQMIDVMRGAGVPLYVGFTYRFAPIARDIHRLVREGAIGKVLSLRLLYLWDCHGRCTPRDSDCINQRRLGRMLEGGPMVDCGVHQIDLARWWLGSEVVAAHGVGAWLEEHDAPDHMYLHLDHAGGAHTLVEISYSYGHTAKEMRPHFVYELVGTDGLIRYDRQARVFELIGRHGIRPLHWTEEKNFDGMYQELERALRTGVDGDMPTASDGLTATRIARAATDEVIRARRHPAT